MTCRARRLSAGPVTAHLPQRLSVVGFRVRDYGIVVAFIALFVTLSHRERRLPDEDNLLNVVYQSAPIGIMACGGTLVIIAGGFDLSVGAISSFAGVIAAKASSARGLGSGRRSSSARSSGLGLGVGQRPARHASCASTPFIATLGSSIIIRGLAHRGHGRASSSRSTTRAWATLGLGSKSGGSGTRSSSGSGFALFAASCSRARRSAATSTRRAATPRRRGSRASGSASSGTLLRDLGPRRGLAGVILGLARSRRRRPTRTRGSS